MGFMYTNTGSGIIFINKTSSQFSLLTASSSSRNSEEFDLRDIQVLVEGKKQPRLKRAHLENF